MRTGRNMMAMLTYFLRNMMNSKRRGGNDSLR